MNEPTYQRYTDAVAIRRKNKRIAIVDIPGSEKPAKTIIVRSFKTKPCTSFMTKRGVGEDAISLYDETLEDVIRAYMIYKKVKTIRLDEIPAHKNSKQ